MEIKAAAPGKYRVLRGLLSLALVALLLTRLLAQDPPLKYLVRNGRMVIEMTKSVSDEVLRDFVTRYDLGDLNLKQFIRTGKSEDLEKFGWRVDLNNGTRAIISKPLFASDLGNPGDMFANNASVRFASISSRIIFGMNRFRDKAPFREKDSMVQFFLRNNNRASRVILSGSFNNWSEDGLAMKRTDSGWVASVKLAPGKWWYKFIVDGNWTVDNDNLLRENDGEANINSVYFKTNTLFTLSGYTNARKVYLSGSFNNWQHRQLEMSRTAGGWALPLYLANGTHTYKFIVDGKWVADEKNKNRLPDGNGGYNSVLRMGNTVTFRLNGFPDAKKVFLSGSFNGWKESELQMEKNGGSWTLPYVIGPGNHQYRFIVDGKWMTDPDNPLATDRKNGNSILIVSPNYTFRLKGRANAKTVYLSGDFNDWSPTAFPMTRKGDEWVFPLHLPPGKVRYKFVVDGNWILDPNNKLWEQNEYQTGNSVLWIGQ
jgi:hypothetical protein